MRLKAGTSRGFAQEFDVLLGRAMVHFITSVP
jgi:hypothetical protein